MPLSSCHARPAILAVAIAIAALLQPVPQACARAHPTTGPTIGGERGRPTAERTSEDYLTRRWAASELTTLAAALRAFREDHGSLPATDPLRQLSPTYLSPAPKADPWGTPYRFDLEGRSPSVTSAGPDRSFDSTDDLRAVVNGAPGEPAPRSPRPIVERGSLPAPAAAGPTGPRTSTEVAWTQTTLVAYAAAIDSFHEKRGHYPATESLDGLQQALVPDHLKASDWSATDGWGQPWRYRVTDTGTSYSLASAGSDGAFEILVPLVPGPVSDPSRDLVVVDGRSVRWPATGPPAPTGGETRGSLPRPSPEEEAGRAAATRARLLDFARLIDAAKLKGGRYPEFDDAARLVISLGVTTPALDSWGRDLSYLTLGSGSRYVLVSPGSDGRLDRRLEDYLSPGFAPSAGTAAGSDIVVVSGKLVE